MLTLTTSWSMGSMISKAIGESKDLICFNMPLALTFKSVASSTTSSIAVIMSSSWSRTVETASERQAYRVSDNELRLFNFLFVNFVILSNTAYLVRLPSIKVYINWITPKKSKITGFVLRSVQSLTRARLRQCPKQCTYKIYGLFSLHLPCTVYTC